MLLKRMRKLTHATVETKKGEILQGAVEIDSKMNILVDRKSLVKGTDVRYVLLTEAQVQSILAEDSAAGREGLPKRRKGASRG